MQRTVSILQWMCNTARRTPRQVWHSLGVHEGRTTSQERTQCGFWATFFGRMLRVLAGIGSRWTREIAFGCKMVPSAAVPHSSAGCLTSLIRCYYSSRQRAPRRFLAYPDQAWRMATLELANLLLAVVRSSMTAFTGLALFHFYAAVGAAAVVAGVPVRMSKERYTCLAKQSVSRALRP